MIGRALVISFSVSLGIESLQLLFVLGRFSYPIFATTQLEERWAVWCIWLFRKGYKVWKQKNGAGRMSYEYTGTRIF